MFGGGKEEWRPIPGFPGYFISSEGRARSGEKPLRGSVTPAGYQFLRLRRGGVSHTMSVHAVVALAFIGPRPSPVRTRHCGPTPDKIVINHKDNDPENNRPSNLEYTTQYANVWHGKRIREGHAMAGASANSVMDSLNALSGYTGRRCCVDECLGEGDLSRCGVCRAAFSYCDEHGGAPRALAEYGAHAEAHGSMVTNLSEVA